MSVVAPIDVLAALGREGSRSQTESARPAERPVIRMITFAALGLYGVLRWSRLMNPAPTGRMLALLALAIVLAACGIALRGRHRVILAAIGVAALWLLFPLSGVPLAWAVHWRVALTANSIGEGLLALPRVLVPYTGVDDWVRTTYVLGAGILLISAGFVLGLAGRGIGDLRRATAALPLIVLAIVPSTVVRPQLPYLQGLLLFGLLAAFVWGERIRHDAVGWIVATCSVAAAGAMVAAPALDGHKPWVNYQALAGSLAHQNLEVFDWSQRYGPLNFPRSNHEVLDVHATRPDYWKTEDLDLFDGRAWVAWTVAPGSTLPAPDQAARSRWTQTLKVTVRGMTTADVIAAGFASPPSDVPGAVLHGVSPGTWTAGAQLGPGDSYFVRVYTPHPSPEQLAAAGKRYPAAALRPYLLLTIPQTAAGPPQQVAFAPFVTHAAPVSIDGPTNGSATTAIAGSPYASTYALARLIANRATTPYAYVAAVERYLSSSQGFAYDENPPQSAYPLATFLTSERLGYCQQFAGAMALLLRMGGIPARVATGFTTGTYDTSKKQWVVTDLDAHAWVEAWFPHYGWVRFDPTPATAPARGGRSPITPFHDQVPGGASRTPLNHRQPGSAAPLAPSAGRRGGSSLPIVFGALGALLATFAAALWITRARARPSVEYLLTELERALARSGRPLTGDVTLAGLEHRFRSSPEASAYIRALRLARFGGRNELPTLHQRRALRTELRAGLGLDGVLRAVWALPPRWSPHRAGRRRHGGA